MTSARSRRASAPAVLLGLVAALLAGCAQPPHAPAPAGSTGVVAVQADPGLPAEAGGQVRAAVAEAITPVAALLPGSWAARVDVRLVASAARLAAEAGWTPASRPDATVAAVAVLAVPARTLAPAGAAVTGARLVVDWADYQRLNGAGRRIVLRHELTHLATAGETPTAMPIWLVEGFAEEVGHEGVVACSATYSRLPGGPPCPPASALSAPVAAGELATEVRAGHLPVAVPTDAAFAAADGRLAQTYQEAWLACRVLAARLGGLPGLARYYRDVATRLTTTATTGPAAAAAGLRTDTGLDWPGFVARWRAYLQTLLGGVPAAF
jgi:hypothetical protein